MIKATAKVQGWFKLQAIRPDGTKRLLADWFPNLILDSGLDLIGTDNYMAACQVGTSNTAPNVAQTSLIGFLAGTTGAIGNVHSQQSVPPYYGSYIKTYRFNAGTATGNLSEVGVGKGPLFTDTLFSRALILDGMGSPTTITVLADEILDVSYELRLYPPTIDSTGTTNISGTDYTWIFRAANVIFPDWSSGIGIRGGFVAPFNIAAAFRDGITAITSAPSNQIYNVPGGNFVYTAGHHYVDMQAIFDVTQGGEDIHSMTWETSLGAYQVSFTPPIPKTSSNQLTIVARVHWDRYAP